MSQEPYILFTYGVFLILGIGLLYLSWHKFEIAILIYSLATFASAVFFNNIEVWNVEEVATGIGGYLRGGSLLFGGIIGLIHYLKNFREHKGKIPIHLVFLFLFLLFSLVSTYYSIDTKNTFVRASLFTSLSLFLLGLYTWLDDKTNFNKLLNTLFFVVATLIVLNLVALFVLPGRVWWWKSTNRFIGLWSHPNEAGGFSMIAYPILLWKLYSTKSNNKYFVFGIVIINLFLQVISGSRTSLIVSSIGLGIWFWVNKEWIKFFALGVFLILGAIIVTQIGLASFTRSEGSKITDLTDRESIWNGAILFAKEKPLLGYGYAVESKIFADQNLYDLSDKNVDINAQNPLHNGYLSIFIGGGLIAFLLWLLALGIPIYLVMLTETSLLKAYALATMVPILISNLVESALTGYLGISDIYFWPAWIVAAKIGISALNKINISSNFNMVIDNKELIPNV